MFSRTNAALLLFIVVVAVSAFEAVAQPATVFVPIEVYGTGRLYHLSFSEDSEYLIAGHAGMVTVYDVDTGTKISRVFTGTGSISASMSRDRSRVITGTYDDAHVWNAATGDLVTSLTGEPYGALSVALSADGSRAITGSFDGTVKIWNANTGTELHNLTGHGDDWVSAVHYSYDETKVLSACWDHTARLWNSATGGLSATFDAGRVVRDAGLSADATRLIMGCDDGTGKLWNTGTQSIVGTFVHSTTQGIVNAVAIARDATMVATGGGNGDHVIKLWRVNPQSELFSFTGPGDWIDRLAFSPDGSMLAGSARDMSVKVWNTLTGSTILSLDGHNYAVNSAFFSPDASTVLTAGSDGVRFWDRLTGSQLQAASVAGTGNLAVSPDFTAMVAVSSWGGATLLNGDGEFLESLDSGYATVALFSPDGQEAFTGGWEQEKWWDAATGAFLRSYDLGDVLSAAFSPDGAQLLTGRSSDVILWNVATGAMVQAFPITQPWLESRSVAYSPDGTKVLFNDGEDVKLCDVATGDVVQSYPYPLAGVSVVAFSPGGSRVLIGAWDGAILWDTVTGEALRQYSGHAAAGLFGGGVSAVAFSPVGNLILTGSGDGTTRLWSAPAIPFSIQSQPEGATKNAGEAHTFSVVTSGGVPPFTYHWFKDSVEIPGAVLSSYEVYFLDDSDSGSYVVEVIDNEGSVLQSDPAVLTVLGSLPATSGTGLLLLSGILMVTAGRGFRTGKRARSS